MPGGEIIKMRANRLKKQFAIIKSFIREPRGINETFDDMVRNFREANRETFAALRGGKFLRR